ncbi:hypothetical protein V6N11_033482 [Hibiscus sabdariffa]|uniref:Reverse transcriptase domain-containing protein n=1 Tax=Hibiscus sabdariffa TaxID=183260 RepID=A0ABR2PY60_9ROSI
MNETLLQPFRSDEIKTVVDEGLSAILNDANGTRAVTRARIGRERLDVSHLFFADDSIRGLRQGDPLSPYLSLICAEGLSVILNDANGTRAVTRARIGRERLEVSHLFFADDSIIFCEASLGGDANLQAALMEYSISSGQQVNYDKSLIFFSGNVDIGLQNQIGRMLGV